MEFRCQHVRTKGVFTGTWACVERGSYGTRRVAAACQCAMASARQRRKVRREIVSLRQRPPGRGGSDHQMVGVGVDTMMVSTKPLMDTIADVGDGTRGASGER